MNRTVQVIALLIAGLGATPSIAATRLVLETQDGTGSNAEKTEIWAEATRMRVNLPGAERSLLYDVDAGKVWSLDHVKRTVLELDRSTATSAASRLRGVESELRARTDDLPPEARAAAEQLLDAAFGAEAAAAPVLELRDTGTTTTIRGVGCRIREVWEDAARAVRFCEATLMAAGVPEAAMLPLRSLSGVVRDIAPILPAQIATDGVAALDLFDRIEGLPLAIETFDGDRVDRTAEIVAVEEADAPGGTFLVPDGYRPDFAIKVRERLGGP